MFNHTCLQIRIIASDGGSPPRTDTTVARVSVNRNLARPKFEPTTYEAKILETTSIGEVIATISAKDEDMRVSHLGILVFIYFQYTVIIEQFKIVDLSFSST